MRLSSKRTCWFLLACICSTLSAGLTLVAWAPAQDPGKGKAPGDKPAVEASPTAASGRFAVNLTEAERNIEAALAKPVACDFHDTPLAEVIADLAKQVELPIELDDKGLEEANVQRKTPITLSAKSLSLRSVLQVLEVQHRLGYMPGLSGLRVTSIEIASDGDSLVVRVYPVLDLLASFPVLEFDGQYDGLSDFITQHIDPDSWAESGGEAAISGYGGCLAIRHSLARHHEIAGLLAGVRKLPADQAEPTVNTVASPVDEALRTQLSGEARSDLNGFLAQVSAAIKTPIVVSSEGLERADVELTASLAGAYRDQPAGKVLMDMLRPLHLTAVAYPEFVLITDQDRDTAQATRLYSATGLPLAKVREGYMPFCGMRTSDSDELMDLITSTIDPDSWSDYGGQGEISSIASPAAIVITASFETHAQIEQLLTSLQETGEAKIALDAKADEQIVERSYPLYLARRQLKVELARPKADPPVVATPATAPPATSSPAAPAPTPKAPAPTLSRPPTLPKAVPAVPAPIRPQPGAEEDKDPFQAQINPAPDQSVLAQFGGMGMGGIAFPGRRYPAQVTEPIPTADEVAELIRELLPDPSWKEEGVLLKPFHDVLIVRQRGPMLLKLEKLLVDIDAWHPATPTAHFGSSIPVVGDWRR